MASSNLDQLGRGHVVTGKVTGSSGTDAALTSNDGSATLTVNGTGDFTVTFGDVFVAAPVVMAQVVDAAFAATQAHFAIVQASATNSVQFNTITNTTSGTTSALADLDFSFIAVGNRDN